MTPTNEGIFIAALERISDAGDPAKECTGLEALVVSLDHMTNVFDAHNQLFEKLLEQLETAKDNYESYLSDQGTRTEHIGRVADAHEEIALALSFLSKK